MCKYYSAVFVQRMADGVMPHIVCTHFTTNTVRYTGGYETYFISVQGLLCTDTLHRTAEGSGGVWLLAASRLVQDKTGTTQYT